MFKIRCITLCLALFSALIMFNPQFSSAKPVTAPVKSQPATPTCTPPVVEELPVPKNVISTVPLRVVQNPRDFLNHDIKMNAIFDKFSTLGLDYDAALRPTADYVGFLIQRDDIVDHNIPLSEMKLFLKRDYAEKFIDLNTGDKIEIYGKVFSTALGDPWIDVYKINILNKIKTENNTKK